MDIVNTTVLASALVAFLLGITLSVVLLQRLNQTHRRERRRLETELANSAFELSAYRKENAGLKQQVNTLTQNQSDTSEDEITTLQGQIDTLKQKYKAIRTKWEKERSHFAEIVQIKNGQLAGLKKDATAAEAHSKRESAQVARIQQLETQLKVRDKTITQLQAAPTPSIQPVENTRIAEIEKERADLLRKISSIDAERATEAAELAGVRQALTNREAELKKANADLETLPSTIKLLNDQLAEKTNALSELRNAKDSDRSALIAEQTRLKSQLADQQQAQDEAHTEALNDLRSDHASLLKEHEEATASLNQMAVLEAQCDRMRQGMESLEKRLDDSTESLRSARAELAHKDAKLNEWEHLAATGKVSSKPDNAYVDQSEKLRALWWENKKLRSAAEARQNSAASATDDTESDQVSALRSEITLLRSELVTLQNGEHGARLNTGRTTGLRAKGYVPL